MKKRKFFSNSGILKWKMPLLISILFWMSLSGTAEAEVQLRSISLRLENVSLSEALSRIEEASGYSFFYDENKIDLSRQVSVNAQNKAVKDILKNILFSTGMTFEISNNQIVLVPEKKAAAKEVSVAVVQQQTHIVKGIVVDNLGEPVPGANVVEKGTTNGIITDMDGAFSLTVAPDAVLEISYIGYVTQSVSVKGKSTLNITLREDSQALEEVVVTGFGLSQKKATLTGAVTAVGSEDISRSVASTASGALVGKIAGLNTRQTDGRPGATTSIQIRNMGDPLYVIDGVQSDAGQFNNIDFNDIESISVLKNDPISVFVGQDGTFSALLFDGEYRLTTRDGNGPWVNNHESVTVNLKGHTEVNLEVTPYFMISNEQLSVTGSAMNASFMINRIVPDAKISRVMLLLSKTQFADDVNNLYRQDFSDVVPGSVNLSADISGNTEIVKAKALYARVGVLANGADQAIYSPVVRLK